MIPESTIQEKQRLKLQTRSFEHPADTITPVQAYLQLRDHFPDAILLESTDHQAGRNSKSVIGLEPIAGISLQENQVQIILPGQNSRKQLQEIGDLTDCIRGFLQNFDQGPNAEAYNGLYGYFGYGTVQHFEQVELAASENQVLPDMVLRCYRYLLVFDHFHHTLRIIHNAAGVQGDRLEEILGLIARHDLAHFPFQLLGERKSKLSDAAYLELVEQGIRNCKRGEVFQIVLSRRFSQAFQGDDFNVYRSLRMVNPSPYLFYFDYGHFRLMGSSPEAQLQGSQGKASLNPIAGTYRRTGDDEGDREAARQLAEDPKENAEHVMLVDLARNDLSRVGKEVKVAKFKEVQYFSHVIHLVSNVECRLKEGKDMLDAFASTFPAGTLSGAPKIRAMQLIEQLEPEARQCYGGSIGYLGFDGSLNQAIFIRSLISQNRVLHYQAGAGVVAASSPASELAEVNNKVAAIERAMAKAGGLQ